MKILQKIKSLFNCSVIPPEHIFNGIGIEYITPIKKSRDKPDEVRYYFMIHFQSGLVIKVQIYTSEIEVPPILLSIRELFINGIGHSYITLYQDEMMDVQIIRYYHKDHKEFKLGIMAKKKQTLPDIKNQDPLEPINIAELGSNGDPCFGIGYDLSTKECKLCGDSELCAFKMSQNMNITRKELEQKNQYKDLDVLEDTVGIKKYIRGLIRKGKERKEVITKTVEKFEVPRKRIRELYKECKK